MKLAELSASRVYRSFAWSAMAMLMILLVGTMGYRVIGGPGYSWVDCFYMTFITVATIGFGEIVDLSHSPGGRLFTVFIAIAGIGTMTYMLSTLTAFILEGDINQVWRRKKMQSKIEKLKDHYRHKLVEAYRRRQFFHDPFSYGISRDDTMVMSTEELATVFHIPSQSVQAPGMTRIQSATHEAPVDLPT